MSISIPPAALAAGRGDISNHLPVCLTFSSGIPKQNKDFSCPKWIADTPGFAEKVKKHWIKHQDPFQSLASWKKAVVNTTKAFFAMQKASAISISGELGLATRVIALIRAASSLRPDKDQVEALRRRHPELTDLIEQRPDGTYDFSKAISRLGTLVGDQATKFGRSLDEDDDPLPPLPSYFPGDGRDDDPLSKLKELLPSSKTRLTHLKAGPAEPLTSDPAMMGDIITTYYGKVWRKDPHLAPPSEVDNYLRIFTETVPPDLQPEPPSYHDFIDAIEVQ